MAKNKKQYFWMLVVIFTGITIVALYIERNTPRGPDATMMNQSMGNMMKGEHLNNITLAQLLGNNPRENMAGHSNHHGETEQVLFGIHRVTTVTIFALIPFILAGAVFLAVVWLR